MSQAETGRVVVVTGGAAGIGAGIAEALGRAGAFVVTLDAKVSLDGAASAEAEGPSTVDRIVAAGGRGREAAMSVTDADAVGELFEALVAEHGSLDAVVNVAGISRPTGFAAGTEDDWRAVLDVHLGGYLTVLRAALPVMAAAGHGRILGVTSGSGWRAADAGAYGGAKRAVAALTWQLGANPPPGVTVNALSPIAATRMVTAALGQTSSRGADATPASGGISLKGFPPPGHLGPIGAYLAGESFSWCSGRVLFSAGAELSLIAAPRLLEVVRSRPVSSLAATLSAVVPGALATAEASQATGGGAMARFADAFDDEAVTVEPAVAVNCLVLSDHEADGTALLAVLEARGGRGATGRAGHDGFDSARERLADAAREAGPLDAIVLAIGSAGERDPRSDIEPWEQVLRDHDDLPGRLLHDAAWMRAAADHSAEVMRPLRVAVVVDATTPGGRSRAQAATQLSRAARGATDDRVSVVVVSVESASPDDRSVARELAAHLVAAPDAEALSGAELCVGEGWIGLRSHPTPAGTVNYGGPALPDWLDDAARALVDGIGSTPA